MKLLLYCTKAKPYLTRNDLPNEKGEFYKHWQLGGELDKKHLYGDTPILNGKIVAECDFEVEKIFYSQMFCNYTTWSLGKDEVLNKSCLTYDELKNYLGTKDVIGNDGYNGYAIHIKNLHIFDEPKELSEYYGLIPKKVNTLTGSCYINVSIDKAPQNMMYAIDDNDKEYILISIKPEWLCKILNGEKTIEVRKKVLKEMMRNI